MGFGFGIVVDGIKVCLRTVVRLVFGFDDFQQ